MYVVCVYGGVFQLCSDCLRIFYQSEIVIERCDEK